MGLYRFWVRIPHGPLHFSLAQAFTPADWMAVIRFFSSGPVHGAVVLAKIAANPEIPPPEGG
jgi:hypothetical protein